jgi:hypothetical protein
MLTVPSLVLNRLLGLLFDDEDLERNRNTFAEIDLGVVGANLLELVRKVEL